MTRFGCFLVFGVLLILTARLDRAQGCLGGILSKPAGNEDTGSAGGDGESTGDSKSPTEKEAQVVADEKDPLAGDPEKREPLSGRPDEGAGDKSGETSSEKSGEKSGESATTVDGDGSGVLVTHCFPTLDGCDECEMQCKNWPPGNEVGGYVSHTCEGTCCCNYGEGGVTAAEPEATTVAAGSQGPFTPPEVTDPPIPKPSEKADYEGLEEQVAKEAAEAKAALDKAAREKAANVTTPATDQGAKLCDTPQKHIDSATIILKHLDPYDIQRMKMTTFTKLPPRAVLSHRHIRVLIPDEEFEKSLCRPKTYYARGIAELLNQMSKHQIEAMGPAWVELFPLLPKHTWRSLNPKVATFIPYDMIIARMPVQKWNLMPVEALDKFPRSFFTNAPLQVIKTLHPKALANTHVQAYRAMELDTIRRLHWSQIGSYMFDARIFNGLGPGRLQAIPWDTFVRQLDPLVFNTMSINTLKNIPPETFSYVRLIQLRAIKPAWFGQLAVGTVKNINSDYLKALGWQYIRRFSPDEIRTITNGAIGLP